MKRNSFFVLIVATVLAGCSFSSNSNYMGTMVGAEIGGVIGEAIGIATHNRGPLSAMTGRVIGTAVGAAAGYQITKQADEKRNNKQNDHNISNQSDIEIPGSFYSNNSALRIVNVSYEDENGDGKISRNETINIIYEVENISERNLNDVELVLTCLTDQNAFMTSPAEKVSIEAGQTIRYKAKAFCKYVPSATNAKFQALAESNRGGNAGVTLDITLDRAKRTFTIK